MTTPPKRLRRVACWLALLFLVPHLLVGGFAAFFNANALNAPISTYAGPDPPGLRPPEGFLEKASLIARPFVSPLATFGFVGHGEGSAPVVWAWQWEWGGFRRLPPVFWSYWAVSLIWPGALCVVIARRDLRSLPLAFIARGWLYALFPAAVIWWLREWDIARLHLTLSRLHMPALQAHVLMTEAENGRGVLAAIYPHTSPSSAAISPGAAGAGLVAVLWQAWWWRCSLQKQPYYAQPMRIWWIVTPLSIFAMALFVMLSEPVS